MKKYRYSLLFVFAAIFCYVLHVSNIFYDHLLMEEADSLTPFWMCLVVAVIAFIILKLKLLGTDE